MQHAHGAPLRGVARADGNYIAEPSWATGARHGVLRSITKVMGQGEKAHQMLCARAARTAQLMGTKSLEVNPSAAGGGGACSALAHAAILGPESKTETENP